MIGAAQADTFGYADAKEAVAKRPNVPTDKIRPSDKARKRFCGSDWTMYLLGWRTYMAEWRKKQSTWTVPDENSVPLSEPKMPSVKVGVRKATVPSVNGATRRSQSDAPIKAHTAPTVPGPVGNADSDEYRRGYADFNSCSIDRHCAPSSANPQDWADYMAGWVQSEQDWDDTRLFPESVRIQISASATITDVSDGKNYHLQSAAVVAGERMDRSGIIEFEWEGVRYSVWPSRHAQFVAAGEE